MIITINPHNAHKDEIAELKDFLNNNFYEYEEIQNKYSQMPLIAVDVTNTEMDGIKELYDYLDQENWDIEDNNSSNSQIAVTPNIEKELFENLLERAIKLGIDIDHYESDLYLPVNDTTKQLLQNYKYYKQNVNVLVNIGV